MRSEIAQPCIGSECSVRSMSRSRVPWRRSSRDRSFIVSSTYTSLVRLLSNVNKLFKLANGLGHISLTMYDKSALIERRVVQHAVQLLVKGMPWRFRPLARVKQLFLLLPGSLRAHRHA